MISAQSLCNGTVFLTDQEPHLVLNYAHINKARGSAVIKVKVKNLKTNVIKELSFRSDQKLEDADTTWKKLIFKYQKGTELIFSDPETDEEVAVYPDVIGEKKSYLIKDLEIKALLWEEDILIIELPKTITYKVDYTEPGFAGNTATGALKPAKLKGGLTIPVPLFVKTGDKIKINTDSGEYSGRV